MIGGFEDPTAGRVLLGGEDVTEQPPYRRDVNTVFQSYALFPHLNVERNVGFGLERRGVGKAEVRTRVGETLELVQLHGLGRRKPGQLSGGQQQRVALARALVNRPRALLLDEPLGALDLRLRRQLQIELKRIQQDVGITFVHVTHDQEEAMTMADEIAVMSDGRIEQAGGAEDLYERPRTAFVANFLGISNLIDGRLGATAGDLTTVETHDGATLHVPGERVGPHDTDAVRVGVRPEKIVLVPAGSHARARHQRAARHRRRRLVPRGLDPVPRPDRGRRGADRDRPERGRRRRPTRSPSAARCSSPGSPPIPSSSPRSPQMSSDPSFEHHLEQFLEQERISRRRLLARGGAMGLSAAGLSAFLAACGGVKGTNATTTGAAKAGRRGQPPEGRRSATGRSPTGRSTSTRRS